MSFEMNHDNNTSTDTGHISVENLNAVSNGNIINASSATLDVISNKDGSSSTVFTADNPSVKMATGQLDVTGKTVLEMNQDKNGNLQNIAVKADSVHYSDKNGVIKAENGNVKINYNQAGNVQSINANAKSLSFQGKDQSINATGGNIALEYGNNNLLKSASAT